MFPLTRDRSRNRSAFGYRPTLNLIFGPNSGDTLDPRITFSRASNATQFDSAGNLVYAPHNLLTFSEQFDNAAWVKNTATVTANVATAPDGTATAELFTATGADSYVGRNSPGIAGGFRYTASIYLRADTPLSLQIFALETAGGAGAQTTVCNVTTVWQRFSVSIMTGTAVTAVSFQIGGASTFSTGETVYAWGAQLNIGTLQPYYPTTVKNALGYSQEFDNAAWVKARSSISATKVTAPDGSVTGQKLVEDTSASTTHFVRQDVTVIAGTRYTKSIQFKAAERSQLQINFDTDGGVFDGTAVLFTASGSGISSVISGTPIGFGITALGNGWYRCWVTQAALLSGTFVNRYYLAAGGTPVYTGDGTSGIFIWGAQLSDSASLDTYTYNPVAAPTAAAYYGPRFDYDPATLAARGLLIEEQRTNSIRNSTMQGAVAGTPGTLPTNWSISTTGATTYQVVGTGTESGIAYVDLRIQGSGAADGWNIIYDSSVVAANGQAWTGSIYLKLSAGSTANLPFIQRLVFRDSGFANIQQLDSSALTPTNAGLATQRNTISLTATQATTAFVTLQLNSGAPTGAYNITLRIGLPQLEQGAFATSVIPTTTAAATRTADVATMVGANFSNWYRQDEGTLFAETQLASASARIAAGFDVNDGTTNNRIVFRALTGGGADQVVVRSASTTVASISSATSPTTAVRKSAVAYKVDDFALSANGATPVTDTSGAVPVAVNQMLIGYAAGPTEYLGGYIRRIAYYPTRLTNAQLSAITS